jgi:TolB-like protein/predicted Zn-dependent protease
VQEAERNLGIWAELKRRNVIRTALLYCVASWLVLQVADVLFGIIGVPDWSLRLVFGILLLGLPIALIFSWVFELTPEGLKRERPAAEVAAHAPRAMPEVPRRLDSAIVALLALALVVFVADRWMSRDAGPAPAPTAAAPGESVPATSLPAAQVPAPPPVPAAMEPPAAASIESPVQPDPRSLAVLPFVNMSGDSDNEYFSDGLTEELLNVLAQIEGLRVAARTSSFRFKGEVGDMADIARQLRVAHLLEGSVRRAGDRVRVTAQLISAADGFHLWSETYDRQLTDIFAIQDDIAAEVARALRVRLLGDTAPAVPRPPTGDVEAYTAYLRGMQALRIAGYDARDQAEAAFREALALDPDFAAAYAGLAQNWRLKAVFRMVSYEDARAEAEPLVTRALALDPDQPRAHALQGWLEWTDDAAEDGGLLWSDRAERAIVHLRHALELEPGQPEASDLLAAVLGYLDRHEEAIAILRRALERDPLSAQLQVLLAYQYIGSNRLAEAASHIERAASMAPRDLWAAQALSYLRYSQGRIGQAIVARTRVLLIDPRDYWGPLRMVQYYLELGMTEAALPWLEAAERMAPEAPDTRRYRALWHWRARERAAAAALATVELDRAESAQETWFAIERMHDLDEGRYARPLDRLLAEMPTALDSIDPGEPVHSPAFWAKVAALPALRLRDGEAATRLRAEALLAVLEGEPEGLPAISAAYVRAFLYGFLGREAEFIAWRHQASRETYELDAWFWNEADLYFLAERDAPAVRAWLADFEAIRERERAWLAAPGRMPDAEVLLAEMARAAETAPEIEPQLMEQFGPRPRLEQ